MIFTVLLNPTLDKIIDLPSFHSGGTFFCEKVEVIPAGKALSVCIALTTLEVPVTFLGLIGASEISEYSVFLKEKRIPYHLVPVEGTTRSNISIVDEVEHRSTHLRFPGFEINADHINQLMTFLREGVCEGDTVIFSGSNPKGTPEDFYTTIDQLIREKKAELVVDTSGNALKNMVELRMPFIKGNIEEFSTIIGQNLNNSQEFDRFPSESDLEEMISITETHMKDRPTLKIITLAQYGALAFNDRVKVHIFLNAPEFTPSYTVGCGDAFLAGLIAGFSHKLTVIETLKLATACGAANTQCAGPGILKASDIDDLLPRVKIVDWEKN